MNLSRISSLLVLSSLTVLSSIATAAVIDFGSLKKDHDNLTSINSSIGNDGLIDSFNFASGSFSYNQSNSNGVIGIGIELPNSDSNTQFRRGSRLGLADKGRIRRSDGEGGNHQYTPIASPVPEPETYAMILAGLGLIGLTIRRRKHHH